MAGKKSFKEWAARKSSSYPGLDCKVACWKRCLNQVAKELHKNRGKK